MQKKELFGNNEVHNVKLSDFCGVSPHSFLKKKSLFMQKKNAFSTKSVLTAILTLVFVVIIGFSSAIIFSNNQNSVAYSDNWLSNDGAYTSKPTETDSEGYYKITTPQQLAYISNMGYLYSRSNIRLYADIDLSKHNWVPIISFAGTFDGQGHKISNMTVVADDGLNRIDKKYRGLFSYLNGATVQNIVFEGCTVDSYYMGGIVAGYIDNKANINSIIISYCEVNTSYDSNKVSSSTTTYAIYAGGICGYMKLSSSISRCFVNDTHINSNNKSDAIKIICNAYAGGIVGQVSSSNISISYFSGGEVKCVGTVKMIGIQTTYLNYVKNAYCGGIAGECSETTIKKCYNTSSVNGIATTYEDANGNDHIVGSYNGGIVGNFWTGSTITDCYNMGTIRGSATEYLYRTKSEEIPTSASGWGKSYAKSVYGGSFNYYIANGATTSPPPETYQLSGTYKDKKSNVRNKAWRLDCYTGGIAGNSIGSISNCYNLGVIDSCGYLEENVSVYYKWDAVNIKKVKTEIGCNLLLEINIQFTKRYFSGNIVGYHTGSSVISNACYEDALKVSSTPTIKQMYYYKGSQYKSSYVYSNIIYNWTSNTDNDNKSSYWFCEGTGSPYPYTFFTIDASNAKKIKFYAKYSDANTTKAITEYGFFETGIPYTFDGEDACLDSFGNNGISEGISVEKLGSDIWAKSGYINGGYPHIKAFYW